MYENWACDWWKVTIGSGEGLVLIRQKALAWKYLLNYLNSLLPSYTIWWHRSESTLVQVMAWWLIISKVLRHSHEANFTWTIQDIYLWYEFDIKKKLSEPDCREMDPFAWSIAHTLISCSGRTPGRVYQTKVLVCRLTHSQTTPSAPSHPLQHPRLGWTPLSCGMVGCWQINSILANIGCKNSIQIWNHLF